MTDYRDLLKIIVQDVRVDFGGYRGLSKACGFSSPNFLQLLTTKKRHTSPKGIASIVKGLNIEGDDKVTILAAFLEYYNKSTAPLQTLLEEAEQNVSSSVNPMF